MKKLTGKEKTAKKLALATIVADHRMKYTCLCSGNTCEDYDSWIERLMRRSLAELESDVEFVKSRQADEAVAEEFEKMATNS